MINEVYNKSDILGAAMQASALTNEVIQNNIANAELPGFKRSTVLFNDVLKSVVDDYKKTGKLKLEEAKPLIQLENRELSYRLDGNNVDIEEEMTGLYKNETRYEVLASSLMHTYKTINLALSK